VVNRSPADGHSDDFAMIKVIKHLRLRLTFEFKLSSFTPAAEAAEVMHTHVTQS
jgi:hypothetical protein